VGGGGGLPHTAAPPARPGARLGGHPVRWNWRERIIGGGVAATAFLVATYSISPAALLIRPGMTRTEVEAVLGNESKPTIFSDWFPRPEWTKEQQAKSLQDYFRNVWQTGSAYDCPWGVVNVVYDARDGEVRVLRNAGGMKTGLGFPGVRLL
jgi:hypothetical protein